MRARIGRLLVRLGLRLMGFRPDKTVMVSDENWGHAQLAAWAYAASRAPVPFSAIIIPREAQAAWDEIQNGEA